MSSKSVQIIGGAHREHAYVDAATNALQVKVVSGSATNSGQVSVGNSTTVPMLSKGTFLGTWDIVRDYATLSLTVFSDVASDTNGLKLQWSSDGNNVDEQEAVTIYAGAGKAWALNVRAHYFRVSYTNGLEDQTSFRVETIYRPSGAGVNSHPVTEVLTDSTLAVMTRSVITGHTTGGSPGGSYENVKVTPSGALTVEATVTGRVNVGTTLPFSSSTRGRPIQVSATASPGTTIHSATTTTGQKDTIYLSLTNTSASAVTTTIEFGATGTANHVVVSVPANSSILAIDGGVLGGAATDVVSVFAATTNVINVFGRVERVS